MAKRMRRLKIYLSILFIIQLFAGSAQAGTVAGFGGSTEITQIMNNVQLVQQAIEQVQQTRHQLNMYMSMIENMKSLGNINFDDPYSALMQLQGAVQQGVQIAYQNGMADEYFTGLNPDYAEILGQVNQVAYSLQYQDWTDSVFTIAQAAFKNADLAVSNIQDDAAIMRTVMNASRNETGQKAVIQAGNEISSLMVQKLIELKGLTAGQVQTQAVYMLTEKNEKATERKITLKAHENDIYIDLSDNKPLVRRRIGE